MTKNKRIRLLFKDDDILSEAQKSDGLNRSWVLFKPHQYSTVSDLAFHLLHAFQLHQSCPHGLLLSMSGFVLPSFESTCILKDDEIIRVRKRRDILAIEGNNADHEVQKLKAADNQPVNDGLLLLANEEFEKEKGGYESDEPKEDSEIEDEEGQLEDMENHLGGNADTRNRKRKAGEKLQGSKKKRQRSEAPENVAKNAHTKKMESSHQEGDRTKKKSISTQEEKANPSAEDNVENNEESSKSGDDSDVPAPDMKRNPVIQENSKETEDGEIAPKETKKGPSRSARRKYAKRRWLREMAKIQKKACESEGLRNWKEDQAKAGRNKPDGQLKGQPKWKKRRSDGEGTEADDQPKGLLHWKQSPQNNIPIKGRKHQRRNENPSFCKDRNQDGGVHDQSNLDGDGHQQPNQQHGDVHELPSKTNGDVIEEQQNQNGDVSEQANQEMDEENEVVPIVIRPGKIRFQPLGKEQAVQQDHVPSETFQWNGITSKKKGQQWGKENNTFTSRNSKKTSSKEYSAVLSHDKEKPERAISDVLSHEQEKPEAALDFDKLPPAPSTPKEGDIIAYRILELSSSWTPELSSYRVGKVSWYNAESNQAMLVPLPEYPIVSHKADEEEAAQPDNSLYKEDGSLEIDLSSLIDARLLIKNGGSGYSLSEGSVSNKNSVKTALPSGNDTQALVPSAGGVDVWAQLSEALNAKREQLSTGNGWAETPKKAQPSCESTWGKNAEKVQPSSENSWGKNAKKVQQSPGNSLGKKAQTVQSENRLGTQSSGGKSWSYKALRGSSLAQTMATLRSKGDI